MKKTLKLTQKKLKELISAAYSHGWHDGQDVIINQVKHVDSGGDKGGDDYFEREFIKPKIGDLYQCWKPGAFYGNIWVVCKDPDDNNNKTLYFYDDQYGGYYPLKEQNFEYLERCNQL